MVYLKDSTTITVLVSYPIITVALLVVVTVAEGSFVNILKFVIIS